MPHRESPAAANHGAIPESVRAGRETDSSEQLDIFAALDEGRRRRDEGQRAAENNTHPGVKAAFERAIREFAKSGNPFTAEDLRARCQPLASSPNVIGAAISAAAKRGEIRRVGFVQAQRAEAHGRWISQWAGDAQ